jgi:hypothetical protein
MPFDQRWESTIGKPETSDKHFRVGGPIKVLYYLKYCSSVGIGTVYELDGRGSISSKGKILLYSAAFRRPLRPTKSPIQWEPATVSSGVNRQEREADHSPLCSCRGKEWCIYNSTPSCVFTAWCFIPLPFSFTFTSSIINHYIIHTEDDKGIGVRFSIEANDFCFCTVRRQALEGSKSHIQQAPELLNRRYRGRSVKLVIHLIIVPRVRMNRVMSTFSQTYLWHCA